MKLQAVLVVVLVGLHSGLACFHRNVDRVRPALR
jgi:hypothetical protein